MVLHIKIMLTGPTDYGGTGGPSNAYGGVQTFLRQQKLGEIRIGLFGIYMPNLEISRQPEHIHSWLS